MTAATRALAPSALVLFSLLTAAQADSPALSPLGSFSSMKQDSEHCNGFAAELWQDQTAAVRGVFRACSGLVGDIYSGRITSGHFDAMSRLLTFQADLSLGMDYQRGGTETPSQDHFVFNGKLVDGKLQGELTHTDLARAHPKPKSTDVLLGTTTEKLASYATIEDWERANPQE